MNELMVPFVVGGALRWLVYTFLLWAMIRIQKIHCNGLGLLASSAAAVLTSYVPVVGSYASYVVLLLCLWKATRASIAPDLLFTVVIASALMFCVDLWAMGAVMGELGLSKANTLVVEADEGQPSPPTPPEAPSPTGSDTNLQNSPQPEPAPEPEPVVQRMTIHPLGIQVKGIACSARNPLAMIQADRRLFTLRPGEGFTFANRKGRHQVRCCTVTPSSVLLELNGKERVELVLE